MGALGKAPDAQGNGLTDLQHRRIIWAYWANQGIIGGCEVEGTSTMSYLVKPGALTITTSADNREAIEVGIQGLTLPTLPAPSSGSRTDYIQVDSDGKVYCTQSAVAGRFTLDMRTVPAGVTSTTSTTGITDRGYAVASTGMLGVLDRWDEGLGHLLPIPPERQTLATGRFVIPGDRRLKWAIRHSATSAGYTDPINTAPNPAPTGAYLYTLTVDGKASKLTFYHSKMWESKNDEIDFWATAGSHTWSITRELWMGAPGITLGNGSSLIPPSGIKIVDQGSTS